jgi:hypothetical protein
MTTYQVPITDTIASVIGSCGESDTLELECGGIWPETLTVPASRMTIGKYGSGPDPIIDGEDARACIVLLGRNYVTIQDIECRNNLNRAIRVENGSSYCVFERLTLSSGTRGIDSNDGDGPISYDCIVRYCTVADMDIGGIAVMRNTSGWLIEHNTVERCGLNGARSGNLIKVWGANCENHVIQYNTCKHAGFTTWGVHVDTCVVGGHIVRYNWCEDNGVTRGGGIQIEKSINCQAYYNVCVNNLFGVLVQGVNATPAHDNLIANNVIVANDYNLRIAGETGETDGVYDNTFQNNICLSATTRELHARKGGENDGALGHGNIYTHNCLGAEYAGFVEWGDSNALNTYDAWETAYGASTHSIRADPLFEDTANDDFRLQAGSPCIDAGVDVGLRRDYLGHPVPQGNAPDVGAYERQRHIPEGPRLPQRIRDRYRAALFVMGR